MALIKNWIITGDCHGKVAERLEVIKQIYDNYNPIETGVIVLGDLGLNFWLNDNDIKQKEASTTFGYTIYGVRGNHEERPENLGYPLKYDSNVDNMIYQDPNFNNIKYFVDGNIYTINRYSCLVIGGAYSIDKEYRLQQGFGWFKDEQLTKKERQTILNNVKENHFDFVFTHTCPKDWEPTDLFLPFVNQDSVDKSMENWLNKLFHNINWGVACFGHYHSDRIERPYVEQFYQACETLDTIWNRWQRYSNSKELDLWLFKSISPNFNKTSILQSKLNNK